MKYILYLYVYYTLYCEFLCEFLLKLNKVSYLSISICLYIYWNHGVTHQLKLG